MGEGLIRFSSWVVECIKQFLYSTCRKECNITKQGNRKEGNSILITGSVQHCCH